MAIWLPLWVWALLAEREKAISFSDEEIVSLLRWASKDAARVQALGVVWATNKTFYAASALFDFFYAQNPGKREQFRKETCKNPKTR